MIIDLGVMTLDIDIVDYIEKVEDLDQGYGIKIAFTAESSRNPRFYYFGKIKEYRPGLWSSDKKLDTEYNGYSIIFSDGLAEAVTEAVVDNEIIYLNAFNHRAYLSYIENLIEPLNQNTDLKKRDLTYNLILREIQKKNN
jgi:hypothetical protein